MKMEFALRIGSLKKKHLKWFIEKHACEIHINTKKADIWECLPHF